MGLPWCCANDCCVSQSILRSTCLSCETRNLDGLAMVELIVTREEYSSYLTILRTSASAWTKITRGARGGTDGKVNIDIDEWVRLNLLTVRGLITQLYIVSR